MDESTDSRRTVDGGPAVIPEGPPPWPRQDPRVGAALQAAFEQRQWGAYQGPLLDQLCARLARMHDVPFVWPCCSGTVAVELGLRALAVGPEDEVIIAGYDFPGNFRAIEAVGARPVLVDVDPKTLAPAVEQCERARSGRTSAFIVSHLHSGMANMEVLCQWAKQNHVAVIEDACQATGAEVQGKMAGSWGDVGVLSFGGSKLLAAGRGGALLTADERVLQRLKIWCQRGNDAFPLSQLQAAVLAPQIEQLPADNELRRIGAIRLRDLCSHLLTLEPVLVSERIGQPSFYKLAWYYRASDQCPMTRAQLVARVQAEGVALGAGFPGFVRRGPRRCRKVGDLRHSRRAAEQLVILHHPVLLEPEALLRRVAQAFAKVLGSA